MKYSIVSEVNMTKHRNVRPPAFSICIPYAEDISWKQMGWNFSVKDWIQLSQEERDNFTQQVQKKYTITELFKKTSAIEEFVTDGWIRRRESYEVDRQKDMLQHIYIVKFLRDDFVCFKITHADVSRNDKSFYFRSHHNSFGPEPGAIMSMSFNKSALMQVTKMSLFFHKDDVYPRGDADFPFIFISTNYSSVFSNSSTYIGLTYAYMTLHYLPEPYKPGCFDYKGKTDMESQEHCIDHCMIKRVHQQFNETSFTATFLTQMEVKIMSKYSVQKNRTKENKVDEIYDSCLDNCPFVECVQTRYLPALVSARDSNDVTLTMYEPNGPETIIIFHAKLTLMELYVQIMSVCGVWLGITLTDVIIRILIIIFRTRSTSYSRSLRRFP
jgi:hypothetical protein